MCVCDFYKILEDDTDCKVILYDTNFSFDHEVFYGDPDKIPIKYMCFVIRQFKAEVISDNTMAYILEIC